MYGIIFLRKTEQSMFFFLHCIFIIKTVLSKNMERDRNMERDLQNDTRSIFCFDEKELNYMN